MRHSRSISAAALVALLGGAAMLGRFRDAEPPLLTAALTLVLLGLSLLLCIPFWRAFDEASREAHKTAWCYGGQTGLTVAAAVFVWAIASGAHLKVPALMSVSSGALIATGIATTFALQVIGYFFFWAGWWLSKR